MIVVGQQFKLSIYAHRVCDTKMNTRWMWCITLILLMSGHCVMGTSSNSSTDLGNSSNTSDICVAGTWCSDGNVMNCAMHSSSLSGSSKITACICDSGYTGENGTTCTACPMNSYKKMNGSAACDLCPVNTSSPMASDELVDCINSVVTPSQSTTPSPENTTVNFIDIKVDLFGLAAFSMWVVALIGLAILLLLCCCITFICMCVGGTYRMVASPTGNNLVGVPLGKSGIDHAHHEKAFEPCMIELGQGRMREMHLSLDSFVNPKAYMHLVEV